MKIIRLRILSLLFLLEIQPQVFISSKRIFFCFFECCFLFLKLTSTNTGLSKKFLVYLFKFLDSFILLLLILFNESYKLRNFIFISFTWNFTKCIYFQQNNILLFLIILFTLCWTDFNKYKFLNSTWPKNNSTLERKII